MADAKVIVFKVTFGLHLFALILLFIAYCSPYWFQSWERVYSPFKRIGLWEACFAGLVLPMDREQKAYHGCWWILASEFHDIRSWVMPWWFILTQVMTTLVLLAEIVNTVIFIYIISKITSDNESGTGKQRVSILFSHLSVFISFISAIVMVVLVIIFGCMVFYDRNWMPYPHLNFLSWSYGLAVVSAFFFIFTSIAQAAFVSMQHQELREPPTPLNTQVMRAPPMRHKDTVI